MTQWVGVKSPKLSKMKFCIHSSPENPWGGSAFIVKDYYVISLNIGLEKDTPKVKIFLI